jgi:hypothetical protein
MDCRQSRWWYRSNQDKTPVAIADAVKERLKEITSTLPPGFQD